MLVDNMMELLVNSHTIRFQLICTVRGTLKQIWMYVDSITSSTTSEPINFKENFCSKVLAQQKRSHL
ncbi:hypothetical protein CJ030_MR4G028412 [Morella rubra]|uniref:Uncharacterized protein n=1 Tax=Morella rubra TaxID=262757 RepID=A0A6A1VX71_9ROSI|nr:hypothetical protein CJ030_MR4G028412 [Morella rubra]